MVRVEGKLEQVLFKIVEGWLNGFFKDVVLFEQVLVFDNKKIVKVLFDVVGVMVIWFVCFEVGQVQLGMLCVYVFVDDVFGDFDVVVFVDVI